MNRTTLGVAAIALLVAVAVAAVTADAIGPRPSGPDQVEHALILEEQGHVREAEEALLGIAAADHRFAPRWALANFYFRQGRRAEFWRWAREGFSVGRYEFEGLMDLCWTVSGDANEIRAVLPENVLIWRSYLRYLGESGRWVAAGPVVERLVRDGGAEDASPILDWADKMATGGKGALVVPAWNRLCERQWVACSAASNGVTNGGFATEPMGRGLDWRFVAAPGIAPRWAPGEIRFQFGADAPGSGELLWQPLTAPVSVDATFDRFGSLEAAPLEWVSDRDRLVLRYRNRPATPGQLVVKQVRPKR